MRSTSFFAALVVVAAVVALVIARHPGNRSSAPSRGTITLIGDSLNVGVERYLPRALPGWKMITNDQIGRSTSDGIAELEAGRPALSNYVVVSLGTNDPPASSSAFRRHVARLLDLAGPNRCVVWATVWRDGGPNVVFNGILRDAARSNQRLQLVEWAEMVERHPEWLAADGLHGNEAGYRERALEIARAARSCIPAQSASAG